MRGECREKEEEEEEEAAAGALAVPLPGRGRWISCPHFQPRGGPQPRAVESSYQSLNAVSYVHTHRHMCTYGHACSDTHGALTLTILQI